MPLESTFTKPNAACEHPERWTAEDGDATENEVIELVAAFVRALQPEFVLETGTYLGFCAEAIGTALERNGHGRLVTLEIDPERAEKARKLCKGLPVEVLNMSSLKYLPDAKIDFAWFDSAISDRQLEFFRYRPAMRSGTIVAFHDTGPQHTLRPDIEALAPLYARTIYLPTPRGVAFCEVL